MNALIEEQFLEDIMSPVIITQEHRSLDIDLGESTKSKNEINNVNIMFQSAAKGNKAVKHSFISQNSPELNLTGVKKSLLYKNVPDLGDIFSPLSEPQFTEERKDKTKR